MKRVAVLYSGGRHWGGIETYLANLFRLNDQARMEIVLVSLGEWDLTRALEQEGLSHLVRILPGKRIRLGTIVALRRIIRAEHFGLIASQGTVANAYARLTALVSGVSSLVVVHSNMMLDYPRATRWVFAISDRALRATTKRYISVSRQLKQKLVESGIAPERVTVIYNGVDPSGRIPTTEHTLAQPPSAGEPEKSVVVCPAGVRGPGVSLATVGRLHPVKNFDSLITAMSLLPGDTRLTVWGDGGEKDSLTALVDRLGLGGRVSLPGESRNMEEALEGADIYIQPSKSEGCSFAVAEAMLHGMPVVVTPCGGLPEMVDDRLSGLVAQDSTPEALARAILVLVNDKSLMASLGEAGRQAAQEKFSMQKWLRETTAALWDAAQGESQTQ
jgi:glycosyltransferase involved in cell wall biosynthesis